MYVWQLLPLSTFCLQACTLQVGHKILLPWHPQPPQQLGLPFLCSTRPHPPVPSSTSRSSRCSMLWPLHKTPATGPPLVTARLATPSMLSPCRLCLYCRRLPVALPTSNQAPLERLLLPSLPKARMSEPGSREDPCDKYFNNLAYQIASFLENIAAPYPTNVPPGTLYFRYLYFPQGYIIQIFTRRIDICLYSYV